MRTMRLGLAAVAVAVAVAALPAPAFGARVESSVNASLTTFFHYRALPGERNRVSLTEAALPRPSSRLLSAILVTDRGAAVNSATCLPLVFAVLCTPKLASALGTLRLNYTATRYDFLFVELGDRDDRVTVRTPPETFFTVDAGTGDDVVDTRDRGPQHVTCGAGADVALLDDADTTAGDCETELRG